MALSPDLLSQFAKLVNKKDKNNESVVYGTIVKNGDGEACVQLDGSNVLTPIGQFSSTTDTKDIAEAERVSVLIKNHTATITGNASSPSARIGTVNALGGEVAGIKGAFEELSARVGTFDQLYVQKGEFDELVVNKLDAKYATIENLEVINQTVVNTKTEVGEFKEVTTKNFSAINADIENLTTDKLDAEEANIKYANIDFANIDFAKIDKARFGELFAESGIIQDYVSENGVVTGKLVAVSIDADNINTGTLSAERIMLQGDDGLFYKLNVNAMGQAVAEQLPADEQGKLKEGIHGKSIIAESITADKISVSDLVAFGATIGGLKISNGAIYSPAKNSVDNGVSGIYMDSVGQMAIGDGSNFIKYYVDENGNFKLAISASSIKFGTGNKTIEDVVNDSVGDIVDDAISNIEIEVGGRNLIRNSNTLDYEDYTFNKDTASSGVETLAGPTGADVASAAVTIDEANTQFTLSNLMVVGTKYTLSFWAKTTSDRDRFMYYKDQPFVFNAGWYKYTHTFTADSADLVLDFMTTGTYYMYNTKLESGGIATDYTPAPEDVDDDIDDARTTASTAKDVADGTAQSVTAVEQAILDIENNIRMLVTGANGESLMTQTANGWTFSTQSIQAQSTAASESLAELVNQLGSSEAAIDRLSNSVDEFGEIARYIYIGEYIYTDERGSVQIEPSIDLFQTDTGFKLKITNTRIIFTDGTTKLIEINSKNRSLVTAKATVESELFVGNPYHTNYIHCGHFDLAANGLYVLDLPVGSYCIFSDNITDTVTQLMILRSKTDDGSWGFVEYITPNATSFEITDGVVFAIEAPHAEINDDSTEEELVEAINSIVNLAHIEAGTVPSTDNTKGAWLWKKRENGNLCLMWIGGTS